MSDHGYICDIFDLSPAHAHELVDIVLANDVEQERGKHDSLFLEVGRLVHLIWLSQDPPARVLKVKLNVRLTESLKFHGFNHLSIEAHTEPGSWFVNKGFTVRSKKTDGYWLQCAFASFGPENLTRSEIIEYLRDVAKLIFDDYKVNDSSSPTIAPVFD